MKNPFWLRRIAWAIASAIIATPLIVASPAAANTAQGYVAGSGTVTDDWGDEGTMSQNSHAHSGATGLWQWVLYADGATESNGSAYDEADIDCIFGPNTAYATRDWQRDHGLTADGIVGVKTLSKAYNNLTLSDEAVIYHGRAHTVKIAYRFAGLNGQYWVDLPGCSCEGAIFLATYGLPVGCT